MMNITPAVKQLLIINIIFFIGSMAVPQAGEFLSLYNLHSDSFRIWQLFTHMFMHGNWMHIFFNMFALLSFGSALEHFWGSKKFVFFYISCGLGAAALQLAINYWEVESMLRDASALGLSDTTLHSILNAKLDDGRVYRPDLFVNEVGPMLERLNKAGLANKENMQALFNAAQVTQVPMVGASGAIYGLLVAFAFMFPNAELMLLFLPIPIKAKYFVPGLLCLDLILGVKGDSIFGGGDGVAHFAHLGGALIGFLMMWYWKKNEFNQNRWN